MSAPLSERPNAREWKVLCALATGDREGERRLPPRIGPITRGRVLERGWVRRFQKPGWEKPGDYWYWQLTPNGDRVQHEGALRGRKYPELI